VKLLSLLAPVTADLTVSPWVVIGGIVLVLRILRWIAEKVGMIQPSASSEDKDPREALRRRRAERQTAEKEGEELWKRLARGEVVEAPRAPAPMPVPAPVRRVSLDDEAEEETDVPLPESLEREEEPVPLSTLGDARAAAERPVSLEVEEEPAPLAALQAVRAAPALRPSASRSSRTALRLGRWNRRRAIVLSEVLGPPVSERHRA
jgi:hypothetical protein